MRKNKNKGTEIDKLLELIKSVPMLYIFATASRTFPSATAKEILEEVNASDNPYGVAVEKFDLITIHKNGVKKAVGYNEQQLKGLQGNFTCICPFHADTSEGSLVITSNNGSKNLWKCFACGAGIAAVEFEKQYFNLQFKDAVYHLAYRLGFIDEKSMKSKSAKGLKVEAIAKQETSIRKLEMELSDEDVMSNVYKAVQKLYPLTSAHEKHLKSVRSLRDSDFGEYFSFPSRDENLAKNVYLTIFKAFCEKAFDKPYKEVTNEEKLFARKSSAMERLLEQMKNVPGFYLRTDGEKPELKWVYKSGIGLLAKDDLGIVRGVQVQNMDPNNKGPKYVWWSSQSMLGQPNCEGGSSAGAPGGVIFPKDPYGLIGEIDVDKAPIVITEGKYKAEALARQGQIAIYVSGVSTWKNIIPIIERVRGDRDKIYVAFDADSLGNTAVHGQLKELCLGLQSMKLNPILLTWSKKFGKGFDDLLLNKGFNNYKYFLKAVLFTDFENVFESELQKLLDKAKVKKVTELSKELKGRFGVALQKNVETALNLPE